MGTKERMSLFHEPEEKDGGKKIQRSGDNSPVNWTYFNDMERSIGVRPKFTRKFVCVQQAL